MSATMNDQQEDDATMMSSTLLSPLQYSIHSNITSRRRGGSASTQRRRTSSSSVKSNRSSRSRSGSSTRPQQQEEQQEQRQQQRQQLSHSKTYEIYNDFEMNESDSFQFVPKTKIMMEDDDDDDDEDEDDGGSLDFLRRAASSNTITSTFASASESASAAKGSRKYSNSSSKASNGLAPSLAYSLSPAATIRSPYQSPYLTRSSVKQRNSINRRRLEQLEQQEQQEQLIQEEVTFLSASSSSASSLKSRNLSLSLTLSPQPPPSQQRKHSSKKNGTGRGRTPLSPLPRSTNNTQTTPKSGMNRKRASDVNTTFSTTSKGKRTKIAFSDGSISTSSFSSTARASSQREKKKKNSSVGRTTTTIAERNTEERESSGLTATITNGECNNHDDDNVIKIQQIATTTPTTTAAAAAPKMSIIEKEKKNLELAQIIQDIAKIAFPRSSTVTAISGSTTTSLDPKILRTIYEKALINGTHQRELKDSGCSLLSLDEVMIPTIINTKLNQLRTMIGKARGRKELEKVNQLQYLRSVLMSCSSHVSHQLSHYREEQKLKRENYRIETQKLLKQQKHEERLKLKQKRLMEKKRLREKRKKEQKKNLSKNKELWREVMVLMTDLTRIEKERKFWSSIDVDSLTMREQSSSCAIINPSVSIDDNNIADDNEDQKQKNPQHAKEMEQCVNNAIDDVILSANRINDALSSIGSLMKESNDIRIEMNEKYKNDHKFYGYLGVKDPKALIRGLTL